MFVTKCWRKSSTKIFRANPKHVESHDVCQQQRLIVGFDTIWPSILCRIFSGWNTMIFFLENSPWRWFQKSPSSYRKYIDSFKWWKSLEVLTVGSPESLSTEEPEEWLAAQPELLGFFFGETSCWGERNFQVCLFVCLFVCLLIFLFFLLLWLWLLWLCDMACDLSRGSDLELRINLDSDVDGIDHPHIGGLTHVGM